jgi:hypothetical protein
MAAAATTILSSISRYGNGIFHPQQTKVKRESLHETTLALQNFSTKVKTVVHALEEVASCARKQEAAWQNVRRIVLFRCFLSSHSCYYY